MAVSNTEFIKKKGIVILGVLFVRRKKTNDFAIVSAFVQLSGFFSQTVKSGELFALGLPNRRRKGEEISKGESEEKDEEFWQKRGERPSSFPFGYFLHKIGDR